MKAALIDNAAELALLVGVVLTVIGLWSMFGRLALAVPGVVCIYLGMPQRAWFIERQQQATPPVEHPRRQAREIRPAGLPAIS